MFKIQVLACCILLRFISLCKYVKTACLDLLDVISKICSFFLHYEKVQKMITACGLRLYLAYCRCNVMVIAARLFNKLSGQTPRRCRLLTKIPLIQSVNLKGKNIPFCLIDPVRDSLEMLLVPGQLVKETCCLLSIC